MRRVTRGRASEDQEVALRWVEDRDHYDFLVKALHQARISVWIATANLKDVHLEAPRGTAARARNRYVSITETFEDLIRAGVELRVLHAAAPSRPFRESLGKRPALATSGEWRRQCPRVHLKMIAVDGRDLYLGSANVTGAGMGAKGDGRRNFEIGVVTSDHLMLDAAQRRFDRIWSGAECGTCRIRDRCPEPLDELGDP